jgi:hypothetical protein
MSDCAIIYIYIYIYIYSIDYWTRRDVSLENRDSGLNDGFKTATWQWSLRISSARDLLWGADKSFNPQRHWPLYPLAPDRPHLEYKSAWANLPSCLKLLHEAVIFHFSLKKKPLQSDTEETSHTCYPCRVVEIWLVIFKSQWKHAISYLWVWYFFLLRLHVEEINCLK